MTKKPNCRRAAAAMLAAIERGKTMDEAVDRLSDLSPPDRRLAKAMVMFALRRRGDISAILAKYIKRNIPGRPHLARALLHIGAVQILLMDIPDHAAVAETVNACGRGEAPYRGLMNAVLRKLVTEKKNSDSANSTQNTEDNSHGLNYDPLSNFPEWMALQWQDNYGAEKAERIADMHCHKPPLDLCFKSAEAVPQFMDTLTQAETADINSQQLSPTVLRLNDSVDVETLPGFDAGEWWVQDFAATLAGIWLDKLLAENQQTDTHILDLCAAPGGKTMQLASMGHQLTALDISASRLDRLKANLSRTKLQADIIQADVMADIPESSTPSLRGKTFDAVLLDAPCSATGTIRRHPDLPLHRREKDVLKLTEIQKDMLDRADQWVRVGGFLAYVTCSLDPREGEAQLNDFLEHHPNYEACAPIGLPEDLCGHLNQGNQFGYLRTTPADWHDKGGMDGFFAGVLRKIKA